jgi:hypothetical protein
MIITGSRGGRRGMPGRRFIVNARRQRIETAECTVVVWLSSKLGMGLEQTRIEYVHVHSTTRVPRTKPTIQRCWI